MKFVCPECQGPLWELRDGELVRYQCLVGHRYSLESLISAHSEELEAALWVALRTLEERVLLQRRLAEQPYLPKAGRARRLFLARAKENEEHARMIRQVLEKVA